MILYNHAGGKYGLADETPFLTNYGVFGDVKISPLIVSQWRTFVTRRQKTYGVIVGIGLISVISYFLARNHDTLQFLLAIPFVGSLLGVLIQVLRDQAAHERSLLLQETENRFVLGISSHMGNTAFDKHVEFSEAYVREAQAALVTLIREGPSEGALQHGWALSDIRNKYVIWLTSDLEEALNPFEAALREIGANAHYVEAVRESKKDGEARSKALEAMYNRFAEVMGLKEWNGQSLTDELAIAALVRKLRNILGTEELTSLRSSILSKATSELRRKG